MISKMFLRCLVLEALGKMPNTQEVGVLNDVERLIKDRNLFPSQEECERAGVDYRFYAQAELHPEDKVTIIEIIWDLIIERIVSPGYDGKGEYPFIRLTSFGQAIASALPHHYEPDDYMKFVKEQIPTLDPIIAQYLHEGVRCFRRQLLFASAVMLGAAAEKGILLLAQAISKSTKDTTKRVDLNNLLERPRLPSVFREVQAIISSLIDARLIPYETHQGCTEHLLSLFEMIRVQRNDAVHPIAGIVNSSKVFLSIQSFPTAIQSVYKLIQWLELNPIP